MPHQFSELTFTPSVQQVQTENGSRSANVALNTRGPANDTLGTSERSFIAERDGFYMASITESNWPYVQFRGGPAGFLHVLDDHTLAFADVTGNRQYISTGNLRANPRVALFLMDYPNQTRLKILAEAEIHPWAAAPAWKHFLLRDPGYRPERVVTLHVRAFDWNCPQHIPQRYTVDELRGSALALRIRELEAENQKLRSALARKPVT